MRGSAREPPEGNFRYLYAASGFAIHWLEASDFEMLARGGGAYGKAGRSPHPYIPSPKPFAHVARVLSPDSVDNIQVVLPEQVTPAGVSRQERERLSERGGVISSVPAFCSYALNLYFPYAT